MALYTTAGAMSEDAPAAEALADRLSECLAYQSLTNTSDAASALLSIVVGPGEPPWDGESFGEDELAQRHCWANVFPPEDGNASVFLGAGVDELYQSGAIVIEVCWMPEGVYLNDDNGPRDCYLFFWDRVAALKNQLWAAIYGSDQQCPRPQAIETTGLGWTSEERETAEGAMLSCGMQVIWGDPGE